MSIAACAEGGFVLVSVLWLLALLTVVTLVLLTSARLDVRAAGQLTRHGQAEALADGLTRLVALRLGDRTRRPLTQLATDGTPLACAYAEADVDIAVTDVGGLVDLNTASLRQLAWLLGGVGLDANKAAAVAAAIVDFRDADDIPSLNGAESAAYRAAGLRHGPKNAPFETITELDQVLGLDLALLARLRPLTTVHSRQPGIDPAKASKEVMAAAAAAAAAAIPTTAAELGRTQIPPEFRSSSRGRAYRVLLHVRLLGGGQFTREATIELVRTAPLGFVLHEWVPAAPAAPVDHSPTSREPCLPTLL